MKALSERSQHVVHLTHNDLDAAGADAIHRLRYGQVFTVWSSVGKFASLFNAVAGSPGRGDLLSISDLGCQNGYAGTIRKAKSNGWRIEWRDHHRWRPEEITAVKSLVDVLHVDPSVCATAIVARDLLPGDATAAAIARVVCDYDLWKHDDPRSRMLGMVVMRKGNRDYIRDRLMEGKFSDPHIEKVYAEITREMQEKIRKSLRHTKIYGTKYRIAFAPLYGYPSETAHAIRDEMGTDIEVVVSPGGKFSIRSVPGISHLIARQFGGGGHPNAAGGNFQFGLPDRIVFLLLKRTGHFTRLAVVAETL